MARPGHIGTDDVPVERSALQYEGTEPGEESVKTEAWKRPVRLLKTSTWSQI